MMDDHLILTWFPVFNSSLVLYWRLTRSTLPKKGTDASWILIRSGKAETAKVLQFPLFTKNIWLLALSAFWNFWSMTGMIDKFVLSWSYLENIKRCIAWSLKKWTNTFPLESWGEKRKRQSRNGRNWFCKRKVPKSQHIQPSSTVLAKYFSSRIELSIFSQFELRSVFTLTDRRRFDICSRTLQVWLSIISLWFLDCENKNRFSANVKCAINIFSSLLKSELYTFETLWKFVPSL